MISEGQPRPVAAPGTGGDQKFASTDYISNSPAGAMPAKKGNRLDRTTFRTSRLLDFASEKELVSQTGHKPDDWPLVVLKELVDNALDACEEAGIAPRIRISVDEGGITVADNGPGLPPNVIDDVLDFNVKVSSREAYVAPTRGAQGNALKTIVAMPFVLDGKRGQIEIEARGVRHVIEMTVDRIRQEPVVERRTAPSDVRIGTTVKVCWPNSAKICMTPRSGSYNWPTISLG